MSELQIGLIGLGGLAVLLVIIYNQWQAYRQRKLVERVLDLRQPKHPDVLFAAERDEAEHRLQQPGKSPAHSDEEGRLEPMMQSLLESSDADFDYAEARLSSLSTPNEPEAAQARQPLSAVYPDWSNDDPLMRNAASAKGRADQYGESEQVHDRRDADDLNDADDTKNAAGERDAALPLSPLLDYIVSFEAVEPLSLAQIESAKSALLSTLDKPVYWFAYDEHKQQWQALNLLNSLSSVPALPSLQEEVAGAFDEALYRRLRVGLQMVDRQGALKNETLSTFHLAMQEMADALTSVADFPVRQTALDMAQQLDQFCAGVDIQIGLNVLSQGRVFLGTQLRALAAAAGMQLDTQGRFVATSREGLVEYHVLNQRVEPASEQPASSSERKGAQGFSSESLKTMTTWGITFLLDVPRVRDGERVFDEMLEQARHFATVLQGVLVDDNRRPLMEEALAPIRRQIAQYQSAMAARKLPAGGALALRLFSAAENER